MKNVFKKILKVSLVVFSSLTVIVILFFVYFNLPVRIPDEKSNLGVTFSMRYAQDIGLDWRQAYGATMDDLGAKYIRVPVYWNSIEKEQGNYDFTDIDWQMDEAEKRGVKIILAVGQKVPRWPECYVPDWIGDDDAKRKERLIIFVQRTVERYKDHPALFRWQIENEPFLDFGICPELDVELLDREIAVARSIDPDTPLMVTDSGELSLWVNAAKRADVFGTTMYREVITEEYGEWKYPIGPNFFKFKRGLIELFADQEDAVVIELQGEPWLEGWTLHFPLERQFESMNEHKLIDNVNFARKTGMNEIYVWGVEWWYWLKETQDYDAVWNVAKRLYGSEAE